MANVTRVIPGAPMAGAPPAPRGAGEAVEWENAYRDALRSLRLLPQPWEIAIWLPEHLRVALTSAWQGSDGWRVGPTHLRELRLAGLVEVSGEQPNDRRNYLGAMGNAVRKFLLETERTDG